MSSKQSAKASGYYSARDLGYAHHQLSKLERTRGLKPLIIGSRYFYRPADVEKATGQKCDINQSLDANTGVKATPSAVAPASSSMQLSRWCESRNVPPGYAGNLLRAGKLGPRHKEFDHRHMAVWVLDDTTIADQYLERRRKQDTSPSILTEKSVIITESNPASDELHYATLAEKIGAPRQTVLRWCKQGYVDTRKQGARSYFVNMSTTKSQTYIAGYEARRAAMSRIAQTRAGFTSNNMEL